MADINGAAVAAKGKQTFVIWAYDSSTGLISPVYVDSNGGLQVSLSTALAKTIDSITSRPEGSTFTDIAASQNAIRSGAGILVGMYVNSTSSGTIKIYDSLTQANTVLNNTITPAIGYHPLGSAAFSTGLSATIGGTLDVTLYYIPTP